MGFKMRGQTRGAESDINVTPLIDVVLVLLIIFMVITPRVIEEMSANLPSKQEQKPPPKPDDDNKPLVVAVYSNGEMALNLEVMAQEALREAIKTRLRAREQKVVFVDAHPDLEYGRVMQVMDMVRDSGADRVGLARMKLDGPARAAAPAEGAPTEGAPATP